MKKGILLLFMILTWNNRILLPAFAAEPAEQTTLYGIGSTSKVITTAAVLKLSEEGKINLDAPLVSYLPEFSMTDERYRLITPRMLLDHTSGLPGSTLNNSMLLGDPDTDNHDELMNRLFNMRLKAAPGEFAVYCNDGFTLAEILVERISGVSFTTYLEEAFTTPMSISRMKTPQSSPADFPLAPIYDSQTKKELPADSPNVIGSGGIYATAQDLCRFSQIFMDSPGPYEDIFPSRAASSMRVSTYQQSVNPDNKSTSLSFGLGWDSVNHAPFSDYGIPALVKGGDTSYYHASLTVLPEENIACAVLSSGGSSAACQLAVQEILLSYLEEIERIEKKYETVPSSIRNPGTADMPSDLTAYSGWYVGASMYELSVAESGTLTLKTVGTGHDKKQTYTYGTDHAFYSGGNRYLGMDGALSTSSNGTTGGSALRFLTDSKGRTYLMAHTYETYPGLGTQVSYYPVAQKITPASTRFDALAAWNKIDQKNFYLVSEKYSSAFYISRFMVQPYVLSEPEGYLTFRDGDLTPAKITTKDHADFFQQAPGHAGRDLSDYDILTKDNQQYLSSGSALYLCEDDIPVLPTGDLTITMESTGKARWFTLSEQDAYGFVTIQVPQKGAYYLYDDTGNGLVCTSSSYTADGSKPILLPPGGKIVFAGESDQTFEISVSGSTRGSINSTQKPDSQL